MTDWLSLNELRSLAANDNEPASRTVVIPALEKFESTVVVRRLGMIAKSMDMPRRAFPDFMAAHLYGEIAFVTESGKRCAAPDVDDFLSERDAGSWFGDLMRLAEAEPRQKPQQRILPRLRLFYMTVMIAYPSVAQHVLR